MVMRVGIIVVLTLLWGFPGVARAHPMLDRAVEAYEEADFAGALRTFETAERNADLSVEELLQLFEMRALVNHALGDQASMQSDLRRLVAVRATYELSRLAPPSVRDAFDEVRRAHGDENRVELRIEEKTLEGQRWMVASVLRVPEGLVDHTTLQCNVDGNVRTVSRTSQGTTTSVKLPDSGAHNGCTATARTRQGGVLFSAEVQGAAGFVPARSSGRLQVPRYETRDDRVTPKKKWPWIVAASALVLAGGVTAGVLVSQRSKGSGESPGAVTVNW